MLSHESWCFSGLREIQESFLYWQLIQQSQLSLVTHDINIGHNFIDVPHALVRRACESHRVHKMHYPCNIGHIFKWGSIWKSSELDFSCISSIHGVIHIGKHAVLVQSVVAVDESSWKYLLTSCWSFLNHQFYTQGVLLDFSAYFTCLLSLQLVRG